MLSDETRQFVEAQRVGHLATADQQAVPHVIPVCFAISGSSLYIAIDGKPKRGSPSNLKRLRNIAENASVCLVVDRYDEDWARLGWVMLHGTAEILTDGRDRGEAHRLLRSRYPQYVGMALEDLPVIAVRITRVAGWGDLSVGD
ncbi:MAG TPA: TIGR03668 family PPOX class F420-dependent oxidoreductase [Hyphomicrobiaceae bacterium]|nr:TIGR03668 family PPOX class F420-dependent oxidoreductase [Hyphomicrobiaceae bacterium]